MRSARLTRRAAAAIMAEVWWAERRAAERPECCTGWRGRQRWWPCCWLPLARARPAPHPPLPPPSCSLDGQKAGTTLEALRGRAIIVGGPKDVTVYLLDRMFAPNGLHRGDYDMVYAGGTPERLRALESGAVQAAILIQPFEFAARREGFPLLIDTFDYVKNLPFSSFAVSRGWLAN